MDRYFSDRELGSRTRNHLDISKVVWGGICSIINSRLSDGSFGVSFPSVCPDGAGTCGVDYKNFSLVLQAHIPEIELPIDPSYVPPIYIVLDLVEFCFRTVARPIKTDYHGFFRHYHLEYDIENGQNLFLEEINSIFSRNGIAYELNSDGEIQRLIEPEFESSILKTLYNTGDSDLNRLLDIDRNKFIDKNFEIRKESLEKLWQAWERLKTLESFDKKSSAKLILDKVTSELKFRETIEKEALELTSIGNTFRIRHHETDKIQLESDNQIDYFYYRMYSLILLILKATGRC